MDGSSTLKQVDAVYFYPSVTAGVIFSDMVTDLERCADHAINIAYALKEHP